MLLVLPRQHFVVAVLANGTYLRGGFDVDGLARATTTALLGTQIAPDDPPTVPLSAAALDAVTGQYTYKTTTGSSGTMLIARSGNGMYEWDDSKPTATGIFPASETKFFSKDRNTVLSFFKSASDEITGYKLTGPSRSAEGNRISPIVDSTVDPDTFEVLAGQYEFSPEFVMTLAKRGSHLCMSIPPSPEVEIIPTSALSFFVLGTNALVRFQRDDTDHIAFAFARNGGGPEGRAKRKL
jgi:hypothetical protein